MIKDKSIFIKNIYYMLSYAFTTLNQGGYEDVATEEFENMHNLFAAILAKGISRQLKQGLYREYLNRKEDVAVVRGKIDMPGTIQNRLARKRVLTCEYDELSENNLLNQILKTTVMLLLRHTRVDQEYKSDLKKEMLFFSNVDTIDPTTIRWSAIRFQRNNNRRRIVSGTVKWVCSLHKDDSTACDSNYYSEERIYDGFISMVNKLRFSEDNILGQVISRLEMTLAAMKRNNLAARDLSKSIAELNAKLLMLEQLRSKGYLAPEVYQAQANEISAELAKLKDVRQEKFNSKAAIMLEEIKKLKMLIFELEEPLEAFDEKLFLEIVKSIQINKEDEMSVELLGGLRFRERI